MMQLHLSDSPLVAVVNDAEVAAVAVISLLMLVNNAAVSDDAAVALISHIKTCQWCCICHCHVAAVEVVNVAAVEVFNLSVAAVEVFNLYVAAVAVINAVAVALITH